VRGAKPAARQQQARLPQQRGELSLAVDVGLPAARHAAEQPERRHLGGGVEQRPVARELANRRQAPGGLCRIARTRGERPSHRELGGQGAVVADPVRVAREVEQ